MRTGQCICSRAESIVENKISFIWLYLHMPVCPAKFPVLLALVLDMLPPITVEGPGLAALLFAAWQSKEAEDTVPWGPVCGTVQGLLPRTGSFPAGALVRHHHSDDFWQASLETGHLHQALRGAWEWFDLTRQLGKSNRYWLSLVICFRGVIPSWWWWLLSEIFEIRVNSATSIFNLKVTVVGKKSSSKISYFLVQFHLLAGSVAKTH